MQRSAGIVACGAYLPRLRLERAAIAAAMGWTSAPRPRAPAGQRSYCNWDEDSITMAVEAARDCLQGQDRSRVRWAGFASTTAPFADRSNAGVVATALDLPETTVTLDSGGSQRAGTASLFAALDWAATGRDGLALVTASDRRLARPGSAAEQAYGHGAAALLVGSGNEVAAIELGRHSLQDDFIDHYRAGGADFDYTLEERWVRDEGYFKLLPKAIRAALVEAGVAAGDVTRFVASCPAAVAKAVAKSAGLPEQSAGEDLRTACGDTGVPHALLLLSAALESAEPGSVIVLATFGQGCDVLVLRTTRVTRRGDQQGASQALANGVADREYVRYLAHSGLLDMDWGMRAERDNRTAPSVAWRKHRDVMAFVGGRCRVCGTVQFPKARACVNPECREFDTQDDYGLAETRGKVKTFTEDWLAFTRSPPHVYGNVAVDADCNVFTEFSDTSAGELSVGAAVRFVFRIKDFDAVRGFRRYFWKATPVRN